MQYKFAKEEQAFREELRSFLKEELPTGWRYGLIETADEDSALARAMRRKLADRGWLTMGWPKEYGGQDASPITQLVFNEEMAYHRSPGKDAFGIGMLGPALMMHGTEEQKRKYLPAIAEGRINWCQGFSEPGSGSDLASLQTQAVRDGSDYLISGQKIWSSCAHLSDWMFVLARTDPDAPKHRGITYFLVDMKTPGITVRPIINMVGDHHFNEEYFDNVRVPAENIVGELNRGWYVAMTTLNFERDGTMYTAKAQKPLDMLIELVNDASANGYRPAISPALRHRLAERVLETEVSRLLAYRIAWMADQGLEPQQEASISKLFSTELLLRGRQHGNASSRPDGSAGRRVQSGPRSGANCAAYTCGASARP